jgi:DNA mismatch endonuclease, patch repair protein
MRAIRSSGNRSTELRLRALVARSGIRGWQMHVPDLPGSPDFYFHVQGIAVFVDGCFWHGCPRCGHIPKTNRSYWHRKLARNKQRDAQITRILRSDGIRVLRLWECQLRDKPSSCLKRLFILLGRGRATRN